MVKKSDAMWGDILGRDGDGATHHGLGAPWYLLIRNSYSFLTRSRMAMPGMADASQLSALWLSPTRESPGYIRPGSQRHARSQSQSAEGPSHVLHIHAKTPQPSAHRHSHTPDSTVTGASLQPLRARHA